MAKKKEVVDFKKSAEYKKDVLEVGQGEFTKLLLAIVKVLLA